MEFRSPKPNPRITSQADENTLNNINVAPRIYPAKAVNHGSGPSGIDIYLVSRELTPILEQWRILGFDAANVLLRLPTGEIMQCQCSILKGSNYGAVLRPQGEAQQYLRELYKSNKRSAKSPLSVAILSILPTKKR